MKKQHVAIIGAGISGLACATELVNAGFRVSVFDKSRGVGGRMSHRQFEKWGADHGAQYFTVRNPLFQAEVKKWLEAKVVQEWFGRVVNLGEDGVKGISNETQRYVGVPTMSAPAKYLAEKLKVSTLHTISELKQSNDKWQVISKENGLLPETFDQVILAVPAPQAKFLIASISEDLAAACDKVIMLPCWTLMAYLKEPLPLEFDAAFVSHGLYSWIARDSHKPGRSPYETWVVQASHDWSVENIDIDQFSAEKHLLKAFKDLTGFECDLYQTHLWRYAKLENPSETNFVIDAKLNISLCGDWLKNSTVEGAWLSGYSLAKKLSLLSSINTIQDMSTSTSR
jgi:predicted NAD/FAD-dependent oxidoreductase